MKNYPNKTLVIILGNTREYELTFKLFKKNVLDHLGADLCLCVGVKPDQNTENDLYFQAAKYKFIHEEHEDNFYNVMNKTCKDINKNFKWEQYIVHKDNSLMSGINDIKGSVAILLYFRWFLLKNLRETGVLEKYDRFIITRSDYIWPFEHININELDSNKIWVPDGEQYGGITDRHAILSNKNIENYLNILEKMLTRPDIYLKFKDDTNLETLIKLHLEMEGVDIAFTPYNMFTVKSANGETRWSSGEFNPRLNYNIKYKTEFDKTLSYSGISEDEFIERLIKNSE